LAALIAVALAVFCLAARAQGNGAAAKKHSSKKTVKHSTAAGAKSTAHRNSSAKTGAHSSKAGVKSSSRSTRGKKRAVPRSSRARLAALHLQPDRIEEIQQALMGAGYLQGPPTGKWDETTKDAMRRYQADNGFPTTGLPEAKSLMKLGLGPHPLPPDVQPTAAAQVGAAASSPKPNPN
jgi:peptidoglycan hydrolase-like protein with peptidoglycan-binding domain